MSIIFNQSSHIHDSCSRMHSSCKTTYSLFAFRKWNDPQPQAVQWLLDSVTTTVPVQNSRKNISLTNPWSHYPIIMVHNFCWRLDVRIPVSNLLKALLLQNCRGCAISVPHFVHDFQGWIFHFTLRISTLFIMILQGRQGPKSAEQQRAKTQS